MPAGGFASGHKPWNRNLKGIHLSPATEFKPGRPSKTKCKIGAVKIRVCKRQTRRAFIKIAQPGVWLERAKVVWESKNGPIPAGLCVHHIDRDTLNDDISNLALVTRAQHLSEHRPEFEHLRARNASLARWGKLSRE